MDKSYNNNKNVSSTLMFQDTFKDKIDPNSSLYKSINNSFLNNNSIINLNEEKEIRELSTTLQKDIQDYLNSIDKDDDDDDSDDDGNGNGQSIIDQNLQITFLMDSKDTIKKQQLYISKLEKQLKLDKKVGDNLHQQSIEMKSQTDELSQLKSLNNELERKNKFLITKATESKLELETHEKENQRKIALKNHENHELLKKITFLSSMETELQDKIKDMDSKYNELERNTQLKIKAIEKEKTNCRTEIVELKHKSSINSNLTSLQSSKDSEIQHLKSTIQKLEQEIKIQKQTLDSTCLLLAEKEKKFESSNIQLPPTTTSTTTENEENKQIIQSLKSENSYLKQINSDQLSEMNRLKGIFEGLGNLELIKQQNEQYKDRLKRLEPVIEKYNNLLVQNNLLVTNFNQLQSTVGNLEKQQSIDQLNQKISQLENENQTLIGKIGEVTANWKLVESRNQDYSNTITLDKETLAEKELKINELTEKIKRIEKSNYLLTRERDNIKNILDSYDQQPPPPSSSDQSSTATADENRLDITLKIERIAELERALKEKNGLIQDYEYKLDCSNGNGNGDFSGIDYREECIKLNKEIEKLMQENALLEARLGKGEYDPTKTKILHFSNNPSSILNDNNGGSGSSDKDVNSNITGSNGTDDHRKLIDENHRLYIQINDSEKKMDRLKQIFKQKINEFREAVYALLGFKIDVDSNNRYKLQSMYAERETDFLIFQQSTLPPPTTGTGNTNKYRSGGMSGQMELLETDFTRSLDKEIKAYLFTCKSIPSFLSQVTIELFSRQTFHS